MEKNDDSHPRAHANIGRDMMVLWHKSTSYIDHNRGGCSAEQLVIDVPLLEKEKKRRYGGKKSRGVDTYSGRSIAGAAAAAGGAIPGGSIPDGVANNPGGGANPSEPTTSERSKDSQRRDRRPPGRPKAKKKKRPPSYTCRTEVRKSSIEGAGFGL